jgi:hypothetical protein
VKLLGSLGAGGQHAVCSVTRADLAHALLMQAYFFDASSLATHPAVMPKLDRKAVNQLFGSLDCSLIVSAVEIDA